MMAGCAVAVDDTGIGIGADDLALVFEPFRQVGSDSGRKAEGTGLGPLAGAPAVSNCTAAGRRRENARRRLDVLVRAACRTATARRGGLRHDAAHPVVD